MKYILLLFVGFISCSRERECFLENWERTATYTVNFPQELVSATEWEYTGKRERSDVCYESGSIINGGSAHSVHIIGEPNWTRIEYQYRVVNY